MNDLKNGIIDINGFLLGPETTMEDVKSFFGIDEHPTCRNAFDFGDFAFENNGLSFKIRHLWFKDNTKTLDQLTLVPIVSDSVKTKYDLSDYSKDWLPYYQEVRSILDEWLEKQLGKPNRSDSSGNEYIYESCYIYTYVKEEPRDHVVTGGFLEFDYSGVW